MQKFKTNVKCGNCKSAVTPHLEKLGVSSWEVDLSHPDRILTIHDDISSEKIISALKEAGYNADQLTS
ncbi:cation transporter [Belliella sp. DSM 111904]|uniref:Cation transporter n=1 Tax=Belliella filtrata TaxID=2923435 RepID=A0ABS9V5A5_9BACT|nr:cation transporter [Belliella filtrata]MCH7411599.1 cation transporter [Belliella filtrata]